ncbi:ABC transporter ATP-binding protein [Deferrisoma camini]|uniref:ABC transporter ATP-binding protein n=1 Tax=Deferrisoma camini TaxID=1035120 RepID=UPI00046D1185|nr:ABC transporter ATP-binding protein [Deferrisoma camini]
MSAPLLTVRGLVVRYGKLAVLHGIDLEVLPGETVCVVGANGAGKSTLLKAIMGAAPVSEGEIRFDGKPVAGLATEEVVSRGLVYVPEGRMLFGPLSVEENLRLGAYVVRDERRVQENLERVYALFPRLKERRQQAAATLSGGEQQMVAIGRGLMSGPKVLMLDEPSLGLAPKLVDEVLETVDTLKAQGMTILLVEQTVREALEIADRGYALQSGRIVASGPGRDLLEDDRLRSAYLGL